MKLPYDVCRCLGMNCNVRLKCLRYRQRDIIGERTPFSMSLEKDGKCDSLITEWAHNENK